MHRTGNAADRPLLRRVARRCGRPSVRLPPRAGASPAPVSASTRAGGVPRRFPFPPGSGPPKARSRGPIPPLPCGRLGRGSGRAAPRGPGHLRAEGLSASHASSAAAAGLLLPVSPRYAGRMEKMPAPAEKDLEKPQAMVYRGPVPPGARGFVHSPAWPPGPETARRPCGAGATGREACGKGDGAGKPAQVVRPIGGSAAMRRSRLEGIRDPWIAGMGQAESRTRGA